MLMTFAKKNSISTIVGADPDLSPQVGHIALTQNQDSISKKEKRMIR